MFSKYYQSELSFLRDTGKAFARAHPQLAGLLAERGADPDVERLLEGFAFLTARIRERIESAVPEISHGLTELLLPHYLKPLPSCAIVEMTPQVRALRSPIKVPAGTALGSLPIEGTSCQFRTTREMDLLPLTLNEALLDPAPSGASVLRLSLQTTEGGRVGVFGAPSLRFYLHGELPTTALMFLFLNRHLTGITVRKTGDTSGGISLPTSAFVPVGLDRNAPLFPIPKTAAPGHAQLLEYFTLPQHFLFFELRGLSEHAGLPEKFGERFEVLFHFDKTPPLPGKLPKDAVKLHCVPVVNLFETTAEPLRQEAPGQPMFVRGASVNPLHMEVYSIENVLGLRAGGERVAHSPFGAFDHLGSDSTAPFYFLSRSRSPLDSFSDTMLTLATPSGVTPPLVEETLSADLVCTNRGLPSQLGLGDIKVPTSTSPTLAQFRNITPATAPVPPPLGEELHWQLLAHLALNQRSLSDAAALRSLVGLYNFQVRSDQTAARANALRAEAIQDVQATPARRFLDGAPIRGIRSVISLDEARLAGPGDAFLFGAALDELFGSTVTLNAFSELVVKRVPSQTEHRFPARNGARPLV